MTPFQSGLAGMFIAVCIILLVLYYHQHNFARAALQGYWNVSDSIYLLISGDRIQLIDIATEEVLFTDGAVKFKYRTLISMCDYQYSMTRSTDDPIGIPGLEVLDDKKISFTLYPVIGDIRICKDGKEVLQLIKDNDMSFQFLYDNS